MKFVTLSAMRNVQVPIKAKLMLTLVKTHQKRHMRIHENSEDILGMSRWRVCICIISTYNTSNGRARNFYGVV